MLLAFFLFQLRVLSNMDELSGLITTFSRDKRTFMINIGNTDVKRNLLKVNNQWKYQNYVLNIPMVGVYHSLEMISQIFQLSILLTLLMFLSAIRSWYLEMKLVIKYNKKHSFMDVLKNNCFVKLQKNSLENTQDCFLL